VDLREKRNEPRATRKPMAASICSLHDQHIRFGCLYNLPRLAHAANLYPNTRLRARGAVLLCPFSERGGGGRREEPDCCRAVLCYQRQGGSEVGTPVYEADANWEGGGAAGQRGGKEGEQMGGMGEVGRELGDVCPGTDEANSTLVCQLGGYRDDGAVDMVMSRV
jgi:hypothetical protein